MKVERYQASGGESERRTYSEDETAEVEVHKKSFSVLWTAPHSDSDFMQSVGSFIGNVKAAKVRLSPADDDKKVSFTDAAHEVEAESGRFDFIRIDTANRFFTWMPGRVGESSETVFKFPEMAVAVREFDRPWLQHFIGETATPQVITDLDPFLDSIAELTSRFV